MRTLIITSKKYGRKTVRYDHEDHALISKYDWHLYTNARHRTFYVHARVINNNGRRSTIRLHRLVMGLKNGDKAQIDHKDRNGLNNQKSNLRKCTSSQNGGNQGLALNNTSGFKGVHLSKKDKKWIARIRVNWKRIALGTFPDKVQAAIAYNTAALKYFGEFALLNKIPS